MEIEALGAGHGDAIAVRWTGGGGDILHGLVDGGPAKYATQLQANLDSMATEFGSTPLALEFVCVSHIDDDHIGGIERLFTTIRRQLKADLALPARVKRLWFNAWERLGATDNFALTAEAAPVVGASVRQGRDLRDIARFLHLDGNAPVGTVLSHGVGFNLDGLQVDAVAPGPKQLANLGALWEKAEVDLPVFTAAYNDRSIPNLSSIALLLQSGGRTALLTGDARGDHVVDGLSAGGFLTGGRLHVDVLKLPHHGSINNVAAEFFGSVTADQYIVSADGVTHGLPNTECLDLLLQSRDPGDSFELLLTNHMPAVEQHLENACGQRPIHIRVRSEGERGLTA